MRFCNEDDYNEVITEFTVKLRMCFWEYSDSNSDEDEDVESSEAEISSEDGAGDCDLDSFGLDDSGASCSEEIPPDIDPEKEKATKKSDTNENNPDDPPPVLRASSSSTKVMYKDTQLFPPDKSKSKSWTHGGFQKLDNGTLDRTHIMCRYCGDRLKYSGSPSNLLNHVNSFHKDQLNFSTPKPAQSLITDFSAPNETKVKMLPKNHPQQVKFKNEIVRWIIDSLRPIRIVEDKHLLNAFKIANPALGVPSSYEVRKEIIKLEQHHRDKLIDQLKDIAFVTCTNDAGSSYGGSSYIDVNIHWIDNEFNIHKKILEVVPVQNGKTAPEYREYVDGVLEKFGVKEKCFMFTTDNEPTMHAAFEDDMRNGCLAHIQSNASKAAFNKNKKVKAVRKKLRKVATKANKSNRFKKAIKRQQEKEGIKVRSLLQEVLTRFTSTFLMIGSYLQAPKSGDIDEEIVMKNLRAVNNALKEVVKAADYQKLKITKDDRELMIDLFPLLNALEEGITLMGAENYSTGSSVLPFLFMFNRMLAPDNENDRPYIIEVKKELSDYLRNATIKNINVNALSIASYLDKRYSTFSFMPGKKKDVREMILRELRDLQELDDIAGMDELRAVKKRRLLSLDIDDDNNEFDNLSKAERELKLYDLEGKISSTENPLLWWKGRKEKFPLLAQLARKYLAIQGTSTAAERVMSTMGNILTKKRLRMKQDLFNSLMFLSDCDF